MLLCLVQGAAFANQSQDQPFRVVGYYTASAFDEPLERLQLDKLTHLMYGFIIPTDDGSLMAIPKEIGRAHL